MPPQEQAASKNGHGDPKYVVSPDVIDHILSEPPPPLNGDITFEEIPNGFEVWYSDRIERDFPDLVDQSADFLEDEIGVLNLGQVDKKMLIADGILTDQVKDALITWWQDRVADLQIDPQQ